MHPLGKSFEPVKKKRDFKILEEHVWTLHVSTNRWMVKFHKQDPKLNEMADATASSSTTFQCEMNLIVSRSDGTAIRMICIVEDVTGKDDPKLYRQEKKRYVCFPPSLFLLFINKLLL